MSTDSNEYDLAVVGAGVIGLGAALAARERGLRVIVLERAAAIVGASVRNFGHVGVTGQSGRAHDLARETRRRWLRLAERVALPVRAEGATLVARGDDEMELLEAFADRRGDGIRVLGRREALAEAPVSEHGVVGGARLVEDLQLDPRTAAVHLAEALAGDGVRIEYGCAVSAVEPGLVRTSRGEVRAKAVVVAVNADVDQFFPAAAADAGIRRCRLEMLALDGAHRPRLERPLLTGTALLRYSGFRDLPGAKALRARYQRDWPEAFEFDINLMATQRADGTLILGDTHARGDVASPFQQEAAFDALLDAARGLFGGPPMRVLQRWQGVYATAEEEFFVHAPADGVRAVSVTTGIGMTCGLGLAASVVDGLFGEREGSS